MLFLSTKRQYMVDWGLSQFFDDKIPRVVNKKLTHLFPFFVFDFIIILFDFLRSCRFSLKRLPVFRIFFDFFSGINKYGFSSNDPFKNGCVKWKEPVPKVDKSFPLNFSKSNGNITLGLSKPNSSQFSHEQLPNGISTNSIGFNLQRTKSIGDVLLVSKFYMTIKNCMGFVEENENILARVVRCN